MTLPKEGRLGYSRTTGVAWAGEGEGEGRTICTWSALNRRLPSPCLSSHLHRPYGSSMRIIIIASPFSSAAT